MGAPAHAWRGETRLVPKELGAVNEVLETAISTPVLPATVLLLVVILYWLIAVIGGLGFDALDFDLDVDTDIGGESTFDSAMSIGAVTLKFLNIGKLPINIWLSVFSIAFWMIAMLWPRPEGDLSTAMIVTIIARNAVLALIPTKLLTQPLRGKFDPVEPDQAEDLLGNVGVVTTAEVTPKGGQAQFTANAAPLLLNVCTAQTVLAKGEEVRIVSHDSEKNVYTVERISSK